MPPPNGVRRLQRRSSGLVKKGWMLYDVTEHSMDVAVVIQARNGRLLPCGNKTLLFQSDESFFPDIKELVDEEDTRRKLPEDFQTIADARAEGARVDHEDNSSEEDDQRGKGTLHTSHRRRKRQISKNGVECDEAPRRGDVSSASDPFGFYDSRESQDPFDDDSWDFLHDHMEVDMDVNSSMLAPRTTMLPTTITSPSTPQAMTRESSRPSTPTFNPHLDLVAPQGIMLPVRIPSPTTPRAMTRDWNRPSTPTLHQLPKANSQLATPDSMLQGDGRARGIMNTIVSPARGSRSPSTPTPLARRNYEEARSAKVLPFNNSMRWEGSEHSPSRRASCNGVAKKMKREPQIIKSLFRSLA
ncbi:hypothetical protein BDV97DRAFT_370592 [Delphinella strobiligena]|nr:hypothetical protein BDV97DRAFT_370592 [Delphinella strobiligena]